MALKEKKVIKNLIEYVCNTKLKISIIIIIILYRPFRTSWLLGNKAAIMRGKTLYYTKLVYII